MKIKLRSKRAFFKRFRILSSGKIKRGRAYTSHLAFSKTEKVKRHLSKANYLSKGDFKRIRKTI